MASLSLEGLRDDSTDLGTANLPELLQMAAAFGFNIVAIPINAATDSTANAHQTLEPTTHSSGI